MLNKIGAEIAVITKGKSGAIIYNKKGKIYDCPAMVNENEIKDKIGAGDTLFGLTSLLLESGCPHDLALLLGNIGAGKNVTGLANSVKINEMDLILNLQSLYKYLD